MYKVLNGLIAVPVSDLLTPADERARGGHKKSFKHMMQHAVPRGIVVPGVPRDLQSHLVNAAAICIATGSDIERCFFQ